MVKARRLLVIFSGKYADRLPRPSVTLEKSENYGLLKGMRDFLGN